MNILKDIANFLYSLVISFGFKLIWAAVVVFAGIYLVKLVVKLMEKANKVSHLDVGVKRFLVNTVKVLCYVLIVIVAAGIVGIPAASFITVLGSAGVAIGLALQGSLSNIAGSILILVNKPFVIGDYIDANGVSGTVEDIGFFYTTLTTPDNKKVTVPNGALSNSNIVNYSAKNIRRVDFTFSVGYESDIELVKKLLVKAAVTHPLVLKEPLPFVGLSTHGDSALAFTLRTWVNSGDYWTVYFDLNETVKAEFDANGIEIPYNQLDVHVKNK